VKIKKIPAITFLLFLSASCSAGTVKERIVQPYPDKSWIKNQPRFGRMDGKKVIYFYGYGESAYKETAMDKASLDSAGQAATAIHSLIKARITPVLNKTGKSREIRFIQVIAKNVNVSGLRQIDSAWQVREVPKDPRRSTSGEYETVFSVITQYALDYQIFLERRNRAIKNSGLPEARVEAILAELSKKDS
jgi:hypothetical protein